MAVRHNISDEENDPAKVGTQYTVRSPHPAFGIDPNIRNEYGHTNYPKWIDHPWKKQVQRTTTYIGRDQTKSNEHVTDLPERVLVKDEDEEKKVMSEKPPKESWGDKDKK